VRPPLTLALALLFATAGCSATITSELTPKRTAVFFEDSRGFDINSQNVDYLGTEAAMWVTSAPNGPSRTEKDSLGALFQESIGKAGFFPVLLTEENIAERFADDRLMRQKADQFIETLNSVTVSDKDLSNPVGKFLSVNDLLVYHIAYWPCGACEGQQKVRIKVRLIDAESGLIVWTATAQQDTEPEDDSVELAKELTLALAEMFDGRFQPKWHKQRFINLSKS